MPASHRLFWTQRQDMGPAARSRHALAFDSKRNKTILFGGTAIPGNTADNFADTWEWDGDHWLQVAQFGPPPMRTHAMTFDDRRGLVVLYHGNSTWEWNGVDWTQVADTGPPGGSAPAMVYDNERECIVLFGGFSGLGDGYEPSTWLWNGVYWTAVTQSGPAARSHHTMAYDSTRQRVVMFGGWGPTEAGLSLFGDTWEWDGTSWEQMAAFGPAARVGHAMAFDAERNRVVLHGGSDTLRAGQAISARRDTWEWDGRHWLQIQDMGPTARLFHALVFDKARKRLLLFGGNTNESPSADLNDTWEFGERLPT